MLIEEEYDPDLMVIQECEDPRTSTASFRAWSGSYLWVGENKNKGLAIFDRKLIGIQALDWPSNGLELFLPCRLDSGSALIGVWTKYANSPNFGYIGQVWKYLQVHGAKISGNRSCLVGDWNSNVRWDEWDRWWNHSDVVTQLAEANIRSVYHDHHAEAQGQESMPTLFHRKDMSKSYHVDYAFASALLRPKDGYAVQIGNPEKWLEHSDHMPLVFRIDD